MVVEDRDIDLAGDKILIEFRLSSWLEAQRIFDNIDDESKEWQDIYKAVLKAFGTKMKEEIEVE